MSTTPPPSLLCPGPGWHRAEGGLSAEGGHSPGTRGCHCCTDTEDKAEGTNGGRAGGEGTEGVEAPAGHQRATSTCPCSDQRDTE